VSLISSAHHASPTGQLRLAVVRVLAGMAGWRCFPITLAQRVSSCLECRARLPYATLISRYASRHSTSTTSTCASRADRAYPIVWPCKEQTVCSDETLVSERLARKRLTPRIALHSNAARRLPAALCRLRTVHADMNPMRPPSDGQPSEVPEVKSLRPLSVRSLRCIWLVERIEQCSSLVTPGRDPSWE